MSGSRFGSWTRRRVGLAVGSITASLVGLADIAPIEAKKKKRKKKRCKKLLNTCVQGGKRKCCGDLRCDIHSGDGLTQTVCCKVAGKPCSEVTECCSPAQCFEGVCAIKK